MTTTNSKFAVTYEIDYIHRVIVGVTAPDAEAAIKLASYAFDEGKIWDDTEEMPLLFDDFEEVEGETLVYSAQEVSWFPEPDASVVAIKQKEFTFMACQALLAGQVDTARDFAMKAMPHVAVALSSEQDDKDHHKESTWKVTSDNGCDPFEVTASSLNDARRDALHAIGWDILPIQRNALAILTGDSLLTSTEVLELANEHDLKLSLILPGGHPATHYLGGFHRDYYFLDGMDGAIQEISSDDFLDTYPDSLGNVWLIIEKTSTVAKTQVLDIYSMLINGSLEKLPFVQ